MSMDAVDEVLRAAGFPTAKACQHGFEAGVGHFEFVSNEPMLHHLASDWQRAFPDTEAAVRHVVQA